MDIDSRVKDINIHLIRIVAEKAQRYPVATCEDFIRFLPTVRWYGISSEQDLEQFWNKIRDDVWVTDMVMDITTDFRMSLTIDGIADWEALAKIIGESIDCLRWADAKFNLADDDFKKRTPENGLAPYFQDNPWLVTCFLMSRLDLKPIIALMKTNQPKKPETEV